MAEKEDGGSSKSDRGITVGSKGTVAVGDCIVVEGGIDNHNNMADRGRRGQQRGDVGEGDLGGRGRKGSGGK
ncbi:hypothetical protein GW17_00042894 [Ensete ventricosum]|nr:hypothetical protein GW17_00042894 [Ensete ventricosum]